MGPGARFAVLLTAGLAVLLVPGVRAQGDAPELSPGEVKRLWHGRLDGRHFVARVRLEMNLAGLRESRELRIWRDDRDDRHERLLIRFEAPVDLRNVGLLYFEQDDQPNDYFLYQPATRRVRRLPETVANEDVYGIDLEFLGFGVAQTEPTRIENLALVTLAGRRAYRLSERAVKRNARFDRRVTWLDAETFVPMKTEHHRGGELVLVAETTRVETIGGVVTPMSMSFRRIDTLREVELTVDEVDYTTPIPDEYFSVMALVRARGD